MKKDSSMKTIAGQVTDLLTQCLAKSIETAMMNTQGESWFEQFKFDDLKDEHPILKYQNSVYDCDLQAMLKLLRYRTAHSETVFNHFGFDIKGTEKDCVLRRKQINLLLDRLITDFRNTILAHPKVGNSDEVPQLQIYDYEEAVRDMIQLAEIFSDTQDQDGSSYYDRMSQLVRQHDLEAAKIAYPISVTLQNEKLKSLSVRQFASACRDNRIDVQAIEGRLCFLSNDYESDLALIRSCRRDRRRRRFLRVGIAAGWLCLLAAAGLLFWNRSEKQLAEKKNQAAITAVEKYRDEQDPEQKLREVIDLLLAAPPEEATQYLNEPDTIHSFFLNGDFLKLTSEQFLRAAMVTQGNYAAAELYRAPDESFRYYMVLFYSEQPGTEPTDCFVRAKTDVTPWKLELFSLDNYSYDMGMIDLSWWSCGDSLKCFLQVSPSFVFDRRMDVIMLSSSRQGITIRLNNGSECGAYYQLKPTASWNLTYVDAYYMDVLEKSAVRAPGVDPDTPIRSFNKYDNIDEYQVEINMVTHYQEQTIYVPAHNAVTVTLPVAWDYPFSYDWSKLNNYEMMVNQGLQPEVNWQIIESNDK